MKVYVVEGGEYEQRSVHHVAVSVPAAVHAIRASYAACGSVIAKDIPVTPCAYAENAWSAMVTIRVQCGHRLVPPIQSHYDISEWDLEIELEIQEPI